MRSAYFLSQDECVENEVESTLPSGFSCTAVPFSERDAVSLSWVGGTPLHRYHSQFNGDYLMHGPVPISLPFMGGASMTTPGAVLRFASGPAVPYDSSMPWRNLSTFPNGEGSGFRTSSIELLGGNGMGADIPPLIEDYQRLLGFLILPIDTVFFRARSLDEESDTSQTTVALWLENRSVTAPVFVHAECGRAPVGVGDYHTQAFTAAGTAFVQLDDADCPGARHWHFAVTVGNAADHVVFNALVSHARASDNKNELVWTNWVPIPSDQATIRQGLREAAWLHFGTTGGTRLLTGYRIGWGTDGCRTGTDICIEDSNGGGVCNYVIGHYYVKPGRPPYGSNADDVRSRIRSTTAHESGHCDLFQDGNDEYISATAVNNICDDSTFRISHGCGHSIMAQGFAAASARDLQNMFCTDSNHRSAVLLNIQTSDGMGGFMYQGFGIRGISAVTECSDLETDFDRVQDQSSWSRLNANVVMVPNTNHTADNFHFRNFALDPDRHELGESVVVR